MEMDTSTKLGIIVFIVVLINLSSEALMFYTIYYASITIMVFLFGMFITICLSEEYDT